ncbi:MAG: NAD-dependent deacylase [Armatimonadetes bacterium]|nr:NAD-dependent deacylase [Akkermansiaceae bacterium]
MKSIFILTGAGISAESGIQTFRGSDGLWEGHRLEDVASPGGFHRDPTMVYSFYNVRRAKIRDAIPNAAHSALARLERDFPGTVTLVTQNIDDLHERAGSRQVVHMHGEAMKARCLKCQAISLCETTLDETNRCPACGTVGTLRPHIVWFGEIPLFLEEIDHALTQADLFVAIGTSGVVYPAAGFAELAARHGIRTIEINPASTEISPHFDEHLRGPATEKVPAWVDGILSATSV